ncbi:antitoxin VbhA family protein [Pantoea agglomerans]|uniref:antitoxin VbhA family protein n=1 Tax=Enterobacter agglomerans TaxID=549 RepID=UPI00320A564F
MSQRHLLSRGFKKAEASLKLEGMDPSGTPLYESVKKRLLAGEITFEQGREEIVAHYTSRTKLKQA